MQAIVVGGGLAGHSAAHTLLEHGARVVLLDKSAFCGGNSTKATSGINGAGTRAQRRKNIADTPEAFEADTTKSAGKLARPALIHALTYESGPAVEWLQDAFGLDLSLVGQMGAHSFPRTHRGAERFPGMMITYALMEKYEQLCKSQPDRARLVNKAQVTRLLTDETGKVTGVRYSKDGQNLEEHGVVIVATGGFSADFTEDSLLTAVEKEWRNLPIWRSVPNLPSLRELPTTNGAHCTGDGIKMAVAIGANTVDMAYVQVHPTGLVDPNEPDAKVKWLAAEALRGSGGILIDGNGKRFCNELGQRDYVSRCMLEGTSPFRLLMTSKQATEFQWHCEHYVGRGVMKIYKSGAELAGELGIPSSSLQQTFEQYRQDSQQRKDGFGKTIFYNPEYRMDDTFHAAIVTPVVHYTMGGLQCDASAQVIGKQGAIEGLYAAGEVVGGIHGENRLGGSSLLDCVVYGRIAGRSAARCLLDAATSAGLGVGPAAANTSEVIELDWANRRLTLRSGVGSAAAATASAKPLASVPPSPAPTKPAAVSPPSNAAPTLSKTFTVGEVAQHNKKTDCWVILHGEVYDVTGFLNDHPGGANSIMAYAGKEAGKAFDMLHSGDILEKYAKDMKIGTIGGSVQRVPASSPGASLPTALTPEEVARHNTAEDCWCIIHGMVYNLTSFLQDHPAGPKIILKYAGTDGTEAFVSSGHPTDIVSQLGLDHLRLGPLVGSTAAQQQQQQGPQAPATAAPAASSLAPTPAQATIRAKGDTQSEGIPPLSQIINLFDFEAVARKVMNEQGWAYYSSGAEDEIAMRENHAAFHRLWLRPRILINVSHIDLSSTMLGYKVKMPVYITSCALGRLAHPEGEVALAKGAGRRGVAQICPTLASCTLEEMVAAAVPGQVQFLQLYVNHNRQVSEKFVRRAEQLGIKAIFVTVDAPQLGRREKDMRMKFTLEAPDQQRSDDSKGQVDRSQGTARAISQFIDPSLCWKDIEWLRSITKLPLVLKGVQCAEDAVMAAERGLEGIVCSNHGGRQLDFARSGIEVLVEVMAALRARGLDKTMEVYVDGGVRRGSDVLKALCLGAKAVGIGRPTLYAMAGYGSEGVAHCFQILEDEMVMNMRLMGAPSIRDLKAEMVCVRSISDHTTATPRDSLADYVYQPLKTQAKL